MNSSEGLIQHARGNFRESFLSSELGEKIGLVREWIIGTGTKLLDSQTSKPYNFEEACQIRKSHEQFEFKCMKALEVFAELCDYRKQSSINLELSELDFMVQSFVEKLNRRTFFVVSCYTYFRLVEELWNILEDLQKREKEVDTYDGTSIKNAISDLEHGVEKCEVRLNGLAHELERLRIILKPSDPDYLGQLEDGFRDACRAATEATQSLKIRKLVLKKHSKLLECEENVYESIGWIEELYENIEVMYEENCVGKNQLESEDLLKKHNDIENQAKTTYTYCIQLLETYGKLCEADSRRLPRNIGLSKTRLFRIWPKLTDRLLELQARTEAAKKIYVTTDMLLTRVQEYLLELSRSPPIFDRKCGSPSTQGSPPVPNDQKRAQLDRLLQEFSCIKSTGLQLIEKLPKGLLSEDIIVNGQITDEVIRVIRLKLYTLWLKVREYEYALLGRNSLDNTTASELAPDWRSPRILSHSSNSTMRRVGSLFDGDFSPVTMVSPQVSAHERHNRPSNPLGNEFCNHNGSEESDDRGQCESVIVRNQSTPQLRRSYFDKLGSDINFTAKVPSLDKPSKVESSSFNSFPINNQKERTKYEEDLKFKENLNTYDMNSNNNFDSLFYAFKRQLSDLTRSNQTRNPGDTVTDIELFISEHDKTKNEANKTFDEFKRQLNSIFNEDDSNSQVSKQNILLDAKQLLDNWITDWALQRENLNYRLGFVNRLEDLQTDLGECVSRLDQLIKATCLSVNTAAETYKNQQNLHLLNKLGATVLSEAEIYQINTINEEVKGMLQTIPAQEQFIQSLINEVEQCEKFQFPNHIMQIKSIWKKYTENLNIFKSFIEKLTKAYNIIPELNVYKSNYLYRVSEPSKQVSSLNQIDGHNLEQAIYAIIKPDCLSLNAENLSKISSTYPQVLWLIQYLNSQLNLIKESQEELDMLMLNMQVGSASPVDLSELVTKSRNNNNNINDQRYNDKKSLTKRSSSPLFSDENSSVGHSNNVNATFKSIPLTHHSFPNNINSDRSVTQMNSNNNFNEINSAPPILCSTWRIIKPLSNIQCKLGDIIKLQCYFNGPSSRDAFSVLWFYRPFKLIKGQLSYGLKERINLTCSNDIVENIKIDFVELMIKNVTAYRAGLYTIRIRNEETGKAMKSNASLTIIPNILEDKLDLEIETLDTSTGLLKPITIEVGYEGLCIIPDVKWTYNGSPINRSIWRIDTDMNRSMLYSANAHISDKGVYECEIRDHVTNTILKTRRSIQIQPSVPVNEQPLVFGNNQTVGMVFVGDPIVIRCPLPSVIKTGSIISVDWLHDKQKIYSMKTTVPKQSVNKAISSRLANFEGNQFQRGETIWRTYLMDNHCVLTTDNVQNTDEGIYRCRIKSDTGIYESSGSLSLVKAVHFSRGLSTLLDVSKGDRTKLTCCLEILPFKDHKITDSINNNNNRTSINQNVAPPSSVPRLSPLPMNQWDQLSLQINWFLNNELLDTEKAKKLNINTNFVNGLATLSINSVSTEHEGDYCCKVESSKGIIQTYGKIVLKKEPTSFKFINDGPKIVGEILKSPNPITINQCLTLTVNYTSNSIPEIIWLKNEQKLDINSSRVRMDIKNNQCTLTIFDTKPEDTGYYTVKLSDSFGIVQETIFIEVKQKSVDEITSMKEDALSSNDHIHNKSVPEEYVNNIIQQASESYLKAKSIIYGPLDTKVNIGDTLRLFCIIRPMKEPLFVHWTHNGQILKNSALTNQTTGIQTWANYPKNGFYILELKSICVQDKGFYGVTISRVLNISGKMVNETVEEAVCWVDVEGQKSSEKKTAPAFIDDEFSPMMEVIAGQVVELKCKVVGNPLPSFFWLKDGDMMSSTNLNFQISQSNGMYKLTLPDVTKQHSGIWDLISYNSQGLIIKSCQLFVSEFINDYLKLNNNETTTNETIINIKPSFNNKFQENSQLMNKQELSVEQHMNKSLETQSKLSESNVISSIQNSKLEPPEFDIMFTDKVMNTGETVCLKCSLKGNPKPMVQWRFNGKLLNLPTDRIFMIQNKNEYILFIYNACENDSGRYEITAENVIGKAICSALLIINSSVKSRHNRPSSEPEYTATEAEKLNIHRRKSVECCHSGTQTPEKKRSSLIRSVSAPLESECDDCYSKMFVRCRACYAPLIREYEDARAKHSKPKSEYLPSLYNGTYSRSKPWTVRRHKCSSGISRRMTGSSTQTRLSRHRSEGSLLHQCPYCDTLMLPVNPPNLSKPKINKVERVLSFPDEYYQPTEQNLSQEEGEDIYYYQPNYKQIVVSHKTTRTKHMNITKTSESHLPVSSLRENRLLSISPDVLHKSTTKPREIPITIQRDNGYNQMKKSQYHLIQSKTNPSKKNNSQSEQTVSIVESSDNDSAVF
ncbi:hypothetical protein MS3_00006740 [Schistosoma haematobium]|uniref:Ig-like domain-containing protein n=1 Tax=Schistosoma haematobium TaxID=6185 RepID=A0A922ISG7_SCHHA|nr:hypothetical protein MS3_00006740 [Schistosoma haematobium]KAH9585520.1 hypothetical protein MS3_00006740 [Schistosoma haematobium]CAH8521084.1 unnamed protein product [Schistosoma haematobium]